MKRIESDYNKTKHGVNVGPLGPSGVKRMYWMLENIHTVAGTSTPGTFSTKGEQRNLFRVLKCVILFYFCLTRLKKTS